MPPERPGASPEPDSPFALSVELGEGTAGKGQAMSESYSNEDAIKVLEQVDAAVLAMAEGKPERARDLLGSSGKKLVKLRADNEGEDLLVILISAEMFNTAPHDLAAIQGLRGQAAKAFRSGDLPTARVHLSKLMSEVHVSTVSISLRRWDGALRQAEELVSSGRYQDAGDELAAGFGDMEEERAMKALPLVLAGHELGDARRSADPATVRAGLEAARYQLRRAEALGYTGKETGYGEIKAALRAAERQSKRGHFPLEARDPAENREPTSAP